MELLAGIDIPLWWILLPVTCLLVYLYSTWPYSQFKQLGISGPPPEPFFGNQRQLSSKGVQSVLLDWSKQYGRVFGMYISRYPLIIISDLEILRTVLVKDFGHFTDRWPAPTEVTLRSNKIIKQGIFFAKGADWKRIRNIVTPAFSSGKLKMMEPFINRCSQDLTENLLQLAHQGTRVDVKEYFGAYTMDVIAGTAFGLQINSQKDHNEPFLVSVKELLTPRTRFITTVLLAILPYLSPLVGSVVNYRLFSSSNFTFLMDSLDTMIEQRRRDSSKSRPVDFMELVTNVEVTEGTGFHKRLTTEEIQGQMILFFIAGFETTASTLQYLSYNLAMHPDVQQRVLAEVDKHLGQETPTYENASKLKYLEQAIQETLRLFPPAPMITRLASKTMTIKGVTIPKGFGVGVNACAVMRDPEYFPEPELFNPDRFSDKSALDPMSFLAFGFGPRVCIGMRLAVLEIKIAMVHVLRKLEFVRTPDLPEKIQVKEVLGSFLGPEKPLMIKAVARQTDH